MQWTGMQSVLDPSLIMILKFKFLKFICAGLICLLWNNLSPLLYQLSVTEQYQKNANESIQLTSKNSLFSKIMLGQ